MRDGVAYPGCQRRGQGHPTLQRVCFPRNRKPAVVPNPEPWKYNGPPRALLQAVLRDEPAERAVPYTEAFAEGFISAAGREIDVHSEPGIVDIVVISAAPAVVVVPGVDLRDIEFAAGGKSSGQFKGSTALAFAVALEDVERGALGFGYDVGPAAFAGHKIYGVAFALEPPS